jgi:hypothetical protein
LAENTTASATVTVACRLPHGIEMMLYDKQKRQEAAPGGMQEVVRYEPRRSVKPIKLNGFSHEQNKAPVHPVQGGFGLTFDVPKAFFDEWYDQHKEQDYIVNGLIFAQDGRRNFDAQLKDHLDQKSGLERIDPKDKKEMAKYKVKAVDAK